MSSAPRSRLPRRHLVLLVSVSFDSSESVTELRASGDFVNTERYAGLLDEVNHHGEWSDKEVLDALHRTRAHFTPDVVESASRIFDERVSRLSQLLGKVQLRSVRFEMRTKPRSLGDQSALLYWHVEVDVLAAQGRPPTYDVFFEPFDGRLTRMIAREY